MLDVFWQLLEFNPDIDDTDNGEQLQKEKNSIAFIGDELLDAEEERMRQLLTNKFGLYKNLIMGAIDHPDADTRITVEQARRLTQYAHETFFRHLRLYDYVLKNTKLSEVKKVTLPRSDPKCGDPLGKAMMLGALGNDTDDELSQATAAKSEFFTDSVAKDTMDEEHAADQLKKESARGDPEEAEYDEGLKTAHIGDQEKQVIHRVTKQWNSKID